LGDTEEFINEDVDLLELFVKQKSAKKIKTTLKGMKFTGQKLVLPIKLPDFFSVNDYSAVLCIGLTLLLNFKAKVLQRNMFCEP
jgi:hypothetical protein